MVEKFCMYAVSQRNIGKENMPRRLWGVFVKTIGDYDRCVAVYHKCSFVDGLPADDMIFLISENGDCCDVKSLESSLRYCC